MFDFLNVKKRISNAENKILKLWEKEKEDKKEEIKRLKEFGFQEMIGKLVICIPNEIENVTVGIATEITHITKAQEPCLVVFDLVRKKEIIPLGKVFAYTEQKFNALNKLEPNERIAIIYNVDDYGHVDKEKTKNETPIPSDEWAEKVKEAIDNRK